MNDFSNETIYDDSDSETESDSTRDQPIVAKPPLKPHVETLSSSQLLIMPNSKVCNCNFDITCPTMHKTRSNYSNMLLFSKRIFPCFHALSASRIYSTSCDYVMETNMRLSKASTVCDDPDYKINFNLNK